MLRARRAVTLLELLVTVTVAGLALSLVAAISVRQQRVVADLQDEAALAGQVGDALSILPIDLSAVSSVSGDIREARDSSIEIRGTIATAVACDTSGAQLVLSPPGDSAATYGSTLAPIEVGDTAWVLTPNDSTETWSPFRVGGIAAAPPGDCLPSGPRLSAAARSRARVAVSLDGATARDRIGAPLRVTRPARYSLYRGSDGQWYLGLREWNNAAARFNTVQPVSGPFLSPGARGIVFQFFDTLGLKLPAPVADTKSIALVRIDVRGQTRTALRALSRGTGVHVDSTGEWVVLRNRR